MRCRLEEEVAALQARCRAADAAGKRTRAELAQLRSSRGGADVVAALPPLPSGSAAAAPAAVLSPKQAKAAPSAVDGAVVLVRKLREAPLPAAAQKLADKLEAVTQVRLCRCSNFSFTGHGDGMRHAAEPSCVALMASFCSNTDGVLHPCCAATRL